MTDAANEQIVRRFLAAIRENNLEELLQIFDPDLVWVVPQGAIPPFAGTHRGAENIAKMMLGVGGTLLPGSMTYRTLLTMSDDRHVMTEVNLRAKARDGRDYDNYYVFVFECPNGRITELREHVDTTYAATFFGAA